MDAPPGEREFMKQEISVTLSGGKAISFETGHWAKQAHGSAVVRIGETVVLATACANAEARAGIDFFPLTVDYREYTYAGGRIPGGFIKREGRPSEREILTSRQIDRPIRPLFPEGFRCETQVIAFVLSADTENDPDVAAINGASVALAISDIPFSGPIGAVRVGLVNNEFIINPTYNEQKESKLNIMVVGTAEGIVMIEAGANEVEEDRVVDAIEFAHRRDQEDLRRHQRLCPKVGRAKRSFEAPVTDQAYLNALRAKVGEALADAVNTEKYGKLESYAKIKELKDSVKAEIPEDQPEARTKAGKYFDHAARARLPRGSYQEPPPSRWPRLRSDSCDLERSWRTAAHSRIGRIHPWRDPGTGHHYAWHQRRHAAPGTF